MNEHHYKNVARHHSSSTVSDYKRRRNTGGLETELQKKNCRFNVDYCKNEKPHGVEIITCMEEMKKQYQISRQLLQVYGDYLTSIRSALTPLQNLKSILGNFYEKEWSQSKSLMDVVEDAMTVWCVYADEVNGLKDSIQKYFDLFEEVQNVLDEWVEVRDASNSTRENSVNTKILRSLEEVEDDLMQRFKVAFASRINLILCKYFGGYMKAMKCFGKDLSKAASKGQVILEALPSTNPVVPLGKGIPPMTLWDVWFEAKVTAEGLGSSGDKILEKRESTGNKLHEKQEWAGEKVLEKRELRPASGGRSSKQKNCEFVYSYVDP